LKASAAQTRVNNAKTANSSAMPVRSDDKSFVKNATTAVINAMIDAQVIMGGLPGKIGGAAFKHANVTRVP
jgi:hypothetical protein